jgi:hypothetical protein
LDSFSLPSRLVAVAAVVAVAKTMRTIAAVEVVCRIHPRVLAMEDAIKVNASGITNSQYAEEPSVKPIQTAGIARLQTNQSHLQMLAALVIVNGLMDVPTTPAIVLNSKQTPIQTAGCALVHRLVPVHTTVKSRLINVSLTELVATKKTYRATFAVTQKHADQKPLLMPAANAVDLMPRNVKLWMMM